MLRFKFVVLVFSFLSGFAFAQEDSFPAGDQVKLPQPRLELDSPLMKALKKRKTTREFSQEMISMQQLGELVWAAAGYNRPDKKKRTAPSALNNQEISLYVALEAGLYRYDAESHSLIQVHGKDIRKETGKQPFVGKTPVNLVYVADYSKMKGIAKKQRPFYAGADTGLMVQNAYLYCSAVGLGCVVRGWFDSDELKEAMELPDGLMPQLCQTVGMMK